MNTCIEVYIHGQFELIDVHLVDTFTSCTCSIIHQNMYWSVSLSNYVPHPLNVLFACNIALVEMHILTFLLISCS